jgi:hypothetical protein
MNTINVGVGLPELWRRCDCAGATAAAMKAAAMSDERTTVVDREITALSLP